jgi:hypothetical protein
MHCTAELCTSDMRGVVRNALQVLGAKLLQTPFAVTADIIIIMLPIKP